MSAVAFVDGDMVWERMLKRTSGTSSSQFRQVSRGDPAALGRRCWTPLFYFVWTHRIPETKLNATD